MQARCEDQGYRLDDRAEVLGVRYDRAESDSMRGHRQRAGLRPPNRNAFRVTRWPRAIGPSPCSERRGDRDALHRWAWRGSSDWRVEAPDRGDHVLLVLIASCWLAVVVMVTALCRAASLGDVSAVGAPERQRGRRVARPRTPIRDARNLEDLGRWAASSPRGHRPRQCGGQLLSVVGAQTGAGTPTPSGVPAPPPREPSPIASGQADPPSRTLARRARRSDQRAPQTSRR